MFLKCTAIIIIILLGNFVCSINFAKKTRFPLVVSCKLVKLHSNELVLESENKLKKIK